MWNVCVCVVVVSVRVFACLSVAVACSHTAPRGVRCARQGQQGQSVHQGGPRGAGRCLALHHRAGPVDRCRDAHAGKPSGMEHSQIALPLFPLCLLKHAQNHFPHLFVSCFVTVELLGCIQDVQFGPHLRIATGDCGGPAMAASGAVCDGAGESFCVNGTTAAVLRGDGGATGGDEEGLPGCGVV